MKPTPGIVYCLTLFLLPFSFTSVAQKTGPNSEMPNILLIVSEDHGQHLSCYGDTVIETPHLDNIAKEGMIFRNAYVTQSVCSPSRSSILTGLYPHQNGHLGLATQGYKLVGGIDNIYALLKTAGYRTGMIGKLHLNPDDSFPIDYHPIQDSNFEKRDLHRYATYSETMINASDEPFFLMVNFPDAHFPFQDTVQGRPANPVSPEEVVSFPYIGFDNERIRSITANYYNCILRLDESVGELIEKLEDSGKMKNTLVIYLSDHGDEMARGKFDIYEASTKVPFLVSWPGKVKKGSETDALISATDIVPTILNAVGLTIPEDIAGKSLLPLFNNPELDIREYVFTEYNCDPILYFPSRAVRDKKYKLIYTLLSDRKNPTAVYYTENRTAALEGSPTLKELQNAPDTIQNVYNSWLTPPKIQLFDLENDPWEFNDISSDTAYAEEKEKLLHALHLWQEETNDPLRFPEKLRALTIEHDGVEVWGKKEDWKYPEYLYENK